MFDTKLLARLAGGAIIVLVVAALWERLLRLLPTEWLMGLAGALLCALAVLAFRVLRRAMDGPRR
jgi:uncharacterized membrane protein